MAKKKREYQASELMKVIGKLYGLEDKLYALDIQFFLEEYLGKNFSKEIVQTDYKDGNVTLRIKSPLFRKDCQMRQSFLLKKIQMRFEKVLSLQIF